MENEKDILQQESLREMPFSVPQGYFASLEDNLRDKVLAPKPKLNIVNVLKPAFALACSFLVIIGLGYGVIKLTNSVPQESFSEYDAIVAQVESMNPAIFEQLDDFYVEDYNASLDLTIDDIIDYFASGADDDVLYQYLASIE